MTDKEKFRKEVEKLKSNLIYGACSSQIAMETRCKEEAYDEVLALLDTMQEEPVSIWHDASKKSDNLEDVVIINPSDNTGEVLTRCTGVNQCNIWAYTSDLLKLDNSCKIGKNLQEEPVSEELEQAAEEYEEKGRIDAVVSRKRDFINGAQWQKVKDQSTIELAEDHAMLAGMEKMKEEMMAKAIDGYVIEDIEEGNGDFLLSADYLPKSMGLKDRQKVKVIVIKE